VGTVVVVAIILCGLANDCTDAGTGRAANDRALQTAAEDRTERSAAGPANQRTLTRPNATLLRLLVMAVVIVVRAIMAVVVIPALRAVPHAVVVGAIVLVLREPGNACGNKDEGGNEDRFSNRAHLPLDAGFEYERWLACKSLPPIINGLSLRAETAPRHRHRPESGRTSKKISLFSQHQWRPVSLGPRILHAETVAIPAIAIASTHLT
jgi:hypothetical protein